MHIKEPLIPRKIWLLWYQGFQEAPFIVKKCINSWVRENPTWDVVVLDSSSINDYITLDFPKKSLNDLTLQLQSDLVRLLLLSQYGGVWADATTFCFKPLDEWIDKSTESGFFVFHQPEKDRIMSSWFIASKKGCPICSKLYVRLKNFLIENNFKQPDNDQKEAIIVLSKFFNQSRHTTKHWFDPVITKVLGVYPYFLLHYMFERLVTDDNECNAIWEKTEKISADLPHLIEREGPFSFPSQSIKKQIKNKEIPLFKLNWRYDRTRYSKDTLLYFLLEENMTSEDINLIRDTALLIENQNLEVAYSLMNLAQKYRPDGSYINKKINEYKKKFQINNGLVNIHFGVHKTATTYIQENLELITEQNFQYTKLIEFRKQVKESGYISYLNSLDWDKKTVISDENMIGHNGTILTGSLYPDFKTKINNFLNPFLNRAKVNVFISIRPMTSFLPSQYCEYLRNAKFITYEKYISKVHINQLKWFDVLHEAFTSNSDLKFYIFDFCQFVKNKDLFLKELTFGLKNKCDPNIKRSRQSFTYKELSEISDGQFLSNKDNKFDPHTEEEKRVSMMQYENDLTMLAEIPNVTILS